MDAVAETAPDVSPLSTAALLIAARSELARLGLRRPKASEVFDATGVGRARAYEIAAEVPLAVAALVRPPGRPPSPPPPTQQTNALIDIRDKVIAYLVEHPGGVTTGGRRRNYSDDYRAFVLDLAADYDGLEHADFASAVAVPLPTLRGWLRGPCPEPEPVAPEPRDDREAQTARIETIVDQWKHWKGDFIPFCNHIKEHFRINYGPTLIGSILEQLGLRRPRRRPGRSPDEKALRGAFETFFPGAQWEGDGSPIVVRLAGHTVVFNLELVVDADTDAVVGLDVRDHEDSDAVVAAFDQGVETTGDNPIVLELDARPSNHCDAVDEALGETVRMPSTPGRPQSNPHVEGAHSLFQNAAPAIDISANELSEIARQVLVLLASTWARTLNHKPRTDRDGRSRIELYRSAAPSDDEVEDTRRRLHERCRRQERALATRRARTDPDVLAVLDSAFTRLGLADSTGNVRAAIARYPLDHILAGIATYRGKADAGSLPHGVDSRYLLGIVRNISQTDEALRVTEALIEERLAARDIMLERLARERADLQETSNEPDELARAAVTRAMKTDRLLDRLFWLEVAAKTIRGQDEAEQQRMLTAAAKRIGSFLSVPYRDRLAAQRMLARKVIPLA